MNQKDQGDQAKSADSMLGFIYTSNRSWHIKKSSGVQQNHVYNIETVKYVSVFHHVYNVEPVKYVSVSHQTYVITRYT